MPALTQSGRELAKFIDHTLLRPTALPSDFERLCQEALEYGFFAVCVPPAYVSLCSKILKKSDVKVCTVVGFPLGYSLTATKTFETKSAVDQGADEIDMVINISALKSGDTALVLDDIRSVVRAASGRTVKVILETCLLTEEEKTRGCEIAQAAGAHFIKTSTGFSTGGATADDIRLFHSLVGGKLGIKASGSVLDAATARNLIALGATRIGTSQGVRIITDAPADKNTDY